MQGIKAVIRSRHQSEMREYKHRKQNVKIFAIAVGLICGTLTCLIMMYK